MNVIKQLPNMPKSLGLVWFPERGIGFHPQNPIKYDSMYFQNYLELDQSDMGEALAAARNELFAQYAETDHIDVGIGGGRFVKDNGCCGYDVCVAARRWLVNNARYDIPWKANPGSISLWDTLEHIQNPTRLLECVGKTVMLSMPIFRDVDHVMASKHYKPGEHVWYFTRKGLIWFMKRFGYDVVLQDDRETQLGREDIGTFVFQKA